MNIADIGPLRLEYEFFGAGPGMDGISSLTLTEKNGKYYCKFSLDITDETEKWVTVGRFSPTDNWRSVINKISSKNARVIQDDQLILPGDIRINGNKTIASELITAAFCGGIVAEITNYIIILPDDQLNHLFNQKTPSNKHIIWNNFIKIKYKCDELNKDLSYFIARHKKDYINLNEIKKDIEEYAKIKSKEEKILEENINWELKPYRNVIEKIINNWIQSHPVSSANGSMGRSIKAGNIKNYVEQYVIKNHNIPKGIHEVNISYNSKNDKIDVDFNKLIDGDSN